jgi:tetratricopeptide (TPR) repeat protein
MGMAAKRIQFRLEKLLSNAIGVVKMANKKDESGAKSKKRRRIIGISIIVLLMLPIVILRFYNAQVNYNDDYDNAIIAYNEAIRLLPNFHDNSSIYTHKSIGYNRRGKAYSAKGDQVQAIADYTQAIKLEPDNAIYLANRGLSYLAREDYESAIADFTHAIQIDPDDTFSNAKRYNWRAEAYENKGEYDMAIADYNASLQINPDDTDAKIGLSRVNDLKLPKPKSERNIARLLELLGL